MFPAQGVEFAYIYEFTHCSVGLGAVKPDLALITYRFTHKIRKIFDTDFLSGSDVDVAVADFIFIFY